MVIKNLISEFSKFIFDYEFIEKPSLYSNLLNGKEIRPIFTDKSGSIVGIWERENNEIIVWIDSEGSPCNVFAKNINHFLEIMPYGPGFIYDYLSAIENHKLSPNLIPHPNRQFTIDFINETYIRDRIDDEVLKNYSSWLNKYDLSIRKDPTSGIEKLIESLNFSTWFNS